MRRFKLLFTLLAACLPAAARAEWFEASGAHFVVYANDSERDIRRFAEQLELFHASLEFITSLSPEASGPSIRVAIYVVSGERAVQRLLGPGGRNIAGFYSSRAGGSIAVVPPINAVRGDLNWSMAVLLHEYSHHFTYMTSRVALPRWLSEGSAEFYASANFPPEGGVGLGRPAVFRAGELFYADDVRAPDLFLPPDAKLRRQTSYYGKSWLLYHYLTFAPQRTGQLVRYIEAMAAGKDSRAAAIETFGDLDQLERDLREYLSKSRMLYLKIPAASLHGAPVSLRRLRPGEAAAMPAIVRSRSGVDVAEAKAVLAELQGVAGRYPDDPAVLAALAEAEFDAGNDMAALAAANRALTLDPGTVNAHVQKGYALFRIAGTAPDSAAAYTRARAAFLALNRLEPDHPLPLIYFYRTFLAQGAEPRAIAVRGMERAIQIAPFDLGLRFEVARAQLRDKRPDAARTSLKPVANNPHGGRLADLAREMLQRLDREPAWDGTDFELPVGVADDDSEHTRRNLPGLAAQRLVM